jgi:hypothetical protein
MRGSCLCGEVVWRAEGPFERMSHCHCSRCRKAHGTAFGTYLEAAAGPFALESGRKAIVPFPSSPGFARPFCGRCGSVVPDGAATEGRVSLPAGSFEGDPGARPLAHIFVGSQAPWYEIHDDLPRFAAYPAGFQAPTVADRVPTDPPGAPRGSCLCDGVGFVLSEPPRLARYCHCGRCRRARSAAFASNLFVSDAGVRFTRGAELLASYKLPDAQHFTQCFCRRCGGKLPRVDPARKLAVVPMGALDDDPGIRSSAHIFVGSKAAWDAIGGGLPQHAESAPA